MEKVLYEKKVSAAGKVSYVPVTPEPQKKAPAIVPVCSEFSNEELITWTASLVMVQIMILERVLPPHTLIARKGSLTAVKDAMLNLVKGLGAPLDDKLINYITDTWNLAMTIMQNGLTAEYDKHMGKLDESLTCNKIGCTEHHGKCAQCTNENFTVGPERSPCTLCCSEGTKCQFSPK